MTTGSRIPVLSKVPSTSVVTIVAPSLSVTSMTLRGDLGTEDFAVAPCLDGGPPPKLPTVIVDNGVIVKQSEKSARIVAVD